MKLSGAFLLLAAAGLLRAHVDLGSITGSITDATGAAVVGAQLKVVNQETNVVFARDC